MANSGDKRNAGAFGWAWRYGAIALAFGLNACNGSESDSQGPNLKPVGGLEQKTLRGPIAFTTKEGWRISIQDGAITVKPAEKATTAGLQYVSQGTREQLGTHELRSWSGDRRSLLLSGGAKITLHGQGGELIRLSIYDGDESHEIDVLTQTLMHSQVDSTIARSRDDAEHDGETGHLFAYPFLVNKNPLLYLANLYVQNAGSDGVPLKQEIAPQALGRQIADVVHAYTDSGPTFPAETEAACDETQQARGGLVQLADSTLEYVSRSGRWNVSIDKHKIWAVRKMGATYQAKWEIWGDPHENLNGKHVKDWEGTRRTLLLDDGTKITMDASGPQGVVQTTSIYDGAQSHAISNSGNTIVHSCVHAQTTSQRDTQESDGETAHLAILRSPESVAGGLFAENIYTETADTNGEAVRTFIPALLGETGEADINADNVNDFYDDPRLGHT